MIGCMSTSKVGWLLRRAVAIQRRSPSMVRPCTLSSSASSQSMPDAKSAVSPSTVIPMMSSVLEAIRWNLHQRPARAGETAQRCERSDRILKSRRHLTSNQLHGASPHASSGPRRVRSAHTAATEPFRIQKPPGDGTRLTPQATDLPIVVLGVSLQRARLVSHETITHCPFEPGLRVVVIVCLNT